MGTPTAGVWRLTLAWLLPVAAAAAERIDWVEPTAPEAAEVRAVGEAAAGALAARLIAELSTALAQGGPEAAVEVCHTKALPLTQRTDPAQPRATGAKRTSLRLRNPANAPDAPERAALAETARRIAVGEPVPAVLIQRIQLSDTGPAEWRVYKPVKIQPACLVCHGDPAAQPAGLREKLRARYPQDAATGYRDGEWRGLLRVTVAAER